jgi:hypothetical protein
MTDPMAATSLALLAWISPCQGAPPAPAPIEIELRSEWKPGIRCTVRLTKQRSRAKPIADLDRGLVLVLDLVTDELGGAVREAAVGGRFASRARGR